MKITIFGSASPKPADPLYAEAQQLGAALAAAGHVVITGGYMGTMEAVSRGAAEAGGHVIGVTCDEIERWRRSAANPWVKQEIRARQLEERIRILIDECDAAVALPGGPGTLAEISVMWNLLAVDAVSPRPLLLAGPGWDGVFQAFFEAQQAYVNPTSRGLVRIVPTVDQVFPVLQTLISEETRKLSNG